MFGGAVAPFLSVKTTNGLTNSGTNGWVASASRFYSPIIAQYLVSLTLSASGIGEVVLKQFNSSNVLITERYMAIKYDGNPFFINNTFILEMGVGDYFQFVKLSSSITISYEGEKRTNLQVRELL